MSEKIDNKAVIAYGEFGGLVICYNENGSFEEAIEEETSDIVCLGIGEPNSNGLWIWEGVEVQFDESDDENEEAYWDGAYRRPTPEELTKIQSGLNPFDDK